MAENCLFGHGVFSVHLGGIGRTTPTPSLPNTDLSSLQGSPDKTQLSMVATGFVSDEPDLTLVAMVPAIIL